MRPSFLIPVSASLSLAAFAPSSLEEQPARHGGGYLPFALEKFELGASQYALSTLDEAVGEALAKFNDRRASVKVAAGMKAALEQRRRAEEGARESLQAELEKAREATQRRGNADELLDLEAALAQLEQGNLPSFETLVGEKAPKGAKSFGGHRYQLFSSEEDRVPWHIARERCGERGGYLACVESREELEFLHDLLGVSIDSAWTGGFNRGVNRRTKSEWMWISERQIDASFWREGQPSGNGPVTHLTQSGKLDDQYRGVRTAFFCEWGPILPTGWEFENAGARGAVVNFKQELDSVAGQYEEQERKLDGKLKRARKKFTDDVDKAKARATQALKRLRTDAARAGLSDEIKRIDMALAALAQERLFPLPPLLAGPSHPEGVAALSEARRFGFSAYKLIEEELRWHEAVQRCEELGGRLALPKTSHQQHFLFEKLLADRSPAFVWVGGSDEEEEGVWRWLDGSQPEYEYGADEGVASDCPDYEAFPWFLQSRYGEDNYLRLRFREGVVFDDVGGDVQHIFICEWVYPAN